MGKLRFCGREITNLRRHNCFTGRNRIRSLTSSNQHLPNQLFPPYNKSYWHQPDTAIMWKPAASCCLDAILSWDMRRLQPDCSHRPPFSNPSCTGALHQIFRLYSYLLKWELRTSLIVQWLGILLAMQGTRVPLVGKLRSHMLWGN